MILKAGKIIVCNNKVYAGANKLDLTKDTVYTHPSSIQCDASSEINSLKSSVSNGKQLVANAITGKGVATSSSDTFATMANNINGLNVGLSDIQKTYIGTAYINTMPDTSHTTLTVTQDIPTMYINGGNVSLYFYSTITNNNRGVDSVQFYYYNSRYWYTCGRSDFTITYNLQTGKYSHTLSSCWGLSIGSITVQNTGDAILVSANVSPGKAGLDDDDDGWTYYDLYWDSACTDRSVKTLQFKLTGSLVWYNDESNHAAGYKMIIPVSSVQF